MDDLEPCIVEVDPAEIIAFYEAAGKCAGRHKGIAAPMTAVLTLLAAAEIIMCGYLADKLPRKVRKQMRDDARRIGIDLDRQVKDTLIDEARH